MGGMLAQMCRLRFLLLLVYAVVALWATSLRLPLIEGTSRYFYQEDDGHHFNHTVEMTQAVVRRGDFNPHYFNKPSLHFYVRIPVVLASVVWARCRGELASVHDLRTRDPRVSEFDGYRWTPSHPTVLEWNRALSIFLSIALVVASMWCAGLLVRSCDPLPSKVLGGADEKRAAGLVALPGMLLVAGLVPAFSLEVVRNSHIIGVDMLMALLSLVTTIVALVVLHNWSRTWLCICCLAAGLSCSSKYNAAPIALVPVVAWWLHTRPSWRDLRRLWWVCPVIAGVVVIGFLIGTPYALLSFRDFLKDLGYEVWHYGVAGHEGHTAERGLPQALFYLRWLCSDGVGTPGVVLAVVGSYWLIRRAPREAVLFLSFPALYVLLMVCQRANFTRNMVVVVPYVGILAALGGYALVAWGASLCAAPVWRRMVVWGGWLALLGGVVYPLWIQAREFVDAAVHHTDSRDALSVWLQEKSREGAQVAVSGRLHMPLAILQLPGIDSFNAQRTSFDELRLQGYAFIVVPLRDGMKSDSQAMFLRDVAIPGDERQQRIPDNPAIQVYRIVAR